MTMKPKKKKKKKKFKKPIVRDGVKSLKVAKRITAEFHKALTTPSFSQDVVASSLEFSAKDTSDSLASAAQFEDDDDDDEEEEEETEKKKKKTKTTKRTNNKKTTITNNKNKNKVIINRDTYQKASQAALRRTSHVRKFVYSTLTALNKRPKKGDKKKVLNGLEVGAVTTEFCCQSPSWIRFRSIDLNSQHPKIEKRDFFALKVREDEFDCILNSMVLNCVAQPEDRGEMLLRMAKMLKKECGVLFITIPRRCVENNPFCSMDIFNECLKACNLSVLLTKLSPKIAFWVCEKKENVLNAQKQNLREKKAFQKASHFSVSFYRDATNEK